MADARAQNRYRVIERLESGGMAEVFRGEAESLAGFKKQVAIKRVLPHLAQNEKFIRMFLDEARLCARLNHTNIVQVFDIGHVENTYFIVMEFVDGVNLKAIIEHTRKRGTPLSMGAVVFVCIQICNGLQYAHELTDSDGNIAHIVHRDMSPPNVLISRRGEIKIVDFGLAKAAQSVEKTDPGVIKGKFGYLAPETAMGQEADAQADIFAVGIMLWELLAGRRLFLGDSDYQTVKLVQQAKVPSIRDINSSVPSALEAIIAKSLARNKPDRYATAEALAEDLAQFLSTHQLAVTSFDIAKIVREVTEERRAQARKEGKRDASIIDKLISEELGRFTSIGEDAAAPGGTTDASGTVRTSDVGSQPLSSDEFVNPSSWANDVLGGDFDPSRPSPVTSLADMLENDERAAGSDRPSFADDDDDVKATEVFSPERVAEIVGQARTSTPPPVPAAAVGSRVSAEPAAPPARRASAPVVAKRGRRGGGLVTVLVVFLTIAGAGAVAWQLQLVPRATVMQYVQQIRAKLPF